MQNTKAKAKKVPAKKTAAKKSAVKKAPAKKAAKASTAEAVIAAETAAAPANQVAPVAPVQEAPAVPAKAKPAPKVELMTCGVCQSEKPLNGFVLKAKKPGASVPEQDPMCGDCDGDRIAAAKAHGETPEQYFNLLESRKRDAAFDKRGAFLKKVDERIKSFARRQDKSLTCGECGVYHGHYDFKTGFVTVLVAPMPVLVKGDLEPLPPVSKIFCKPHMKDYADGLRKATGNEKLVVEALNVLDVIDKIAAINSWRAKERTKLAAEALIYAQPTQNYRVDPRRKSVPQQGKGEGRIQRPAPRVAAPAPAAAPAAKPAPTKEAVPANPVEKFNRRYGPASKAAAPAKETVRREDLTDVHTDKVTVEDAGAVTKVIVEGQGYTEVGEPSGKLLFGKLAESTVDMR